MSLLVVGSIGYDTIETDTDKIENALGGAAIHFSAASSLFSPTRVVGIVGEDFEMRDLQFLTDRDTDLSGVVVEKGKTFRWSCKYHADMNDRDTLSTELNVFENFRPEIPDSFRDSDYLFLANIHPELQMEVLNQVNKPVFTALDTMNFWIEGNRSQLVEVLKKVDVVFLNDTEALDFSGERFVYGAAKAISKFGPATVIIKKGEHGVIMYHDDTFFALPAYLLDSVKDPTGAGDAFAGGFMGYIAMQNSTGRDAFRRGLAYGTCVAAFTCEEFGPKRLAEIDKDIVDGRLDEFQEMIRIS
ncbi:sugar kinase [candidate division KSB1 bacterium]|nr:sugar kinase [candidate division KSB1 bacterium]